jgi:micrococcal nuclease
VARRNKAPLLLFTVAAALLLLIVPYVYLMAPPRGTIRGRIVEVLPAGGPERRGLYEVKVALATGDRVIGLTKAQHDAARPGDYVYASGGSAPELRLGSGRVTVIIDGDTIEIDRGRERVRYIGMDSPELGRAGRPDQPCSREAARANAELVDGREVELEPDPRVPDRDKYGRLLRYVYVTDGAGGRTFVNRELVRRGLAEAVDFGERPTRLGELENAEQEARTAGFGIWAR